MEVVRSSVYGHFYTKRLLPPTAWNAPANGLKNAGYKKITPNLHLSALAFCHNMSAGKKR
jgi:hypothetical protein